MMDYMGIVEAAKANASHDAPKQLWAADVLRTIIMQERRAGAARLFWAWRVNAERLWRGKIPFTDDPDDKNPPMDWGFDSFQEWLEYACEKQGVTRTTKAHMVAFATALGPWLSANDVIDADGARITPQVFLDRAGMGKIHDIRSAWWSEWKSLDALRFELETSVGAPSKEKVDEFVERKKEVDNLMLECVAIVTNEEITREDLNDIMITRGWRVPRVSEPKVASWKWASLSSTDEETLCIHIPKRDMPFLKDRLWMFMEPNPRPPSEIFPHTLAIEEKHGADTPRSKPKTSDT